MCTLVAALLCGAGLQYVCCMEAPWAGACHLHPLNYTLVNHASLSASGSSVSRGDGTLDCALLQVTSIALLQTSAKPDDTPYFSCRGSQLAVSERHGRHTCIIQQTSRFSAVNTLGARIRTAWHAVLAGAALRILAVGCVICAHPLVCSAQHTPPIKRKMQLLEGWFLGVTTNTAAFKRASDPRELTSTVQNQASRYTWGAIAVLQPCLDAKSYAAVCQATQALQKLAVAPLRFGAFEEQSQVHSTVHTGSIRCADVEPCLNEQRCSAGPREAGKIVLSPLGHASC